MDFDQACDSCRDNLHTEFIGVNFDNEIRLTLHVIDDGDVEVLRVLRDNEDVTDRLDACSIDLPSIVWAAEE